LTAAGPIIKGGAILLERGRITAVGTDIATPVGAMVIGVESRGELITKLRQLLDDARDWPSRRTSVEENRSRPLAAPPADLEALQPVIAGTLPLFVFADRVAEIDASLRIAIDYKIRVVLGGASEAWQRADRLAAAGIPVVVGGIRNIPSSFDKLGAREDNAALLRRVERRSVRVLDRGRGGDHPWHARRCAQPPG
jgi:imidazolonepropionase-like amidohydrolase